MVRKKVGALVFFLCLILAVAALTLFFQNLDGQPPPGELFAVARSGIQEAVEKSSLPSISVAVARNGKILWEESFGWADAENGIKATPRTPYSLASISKPFTATGVMVLAERGLIDLDKPANDYLGKAKLKAYAGKAEEATVRRLLHHTAGLATHWNFFYEDDPYRRPDMDESIRRYGILVVPPGVMYNYANFGYGVLESIIERVSGIDFRDFMIKEVFQPLDLFDTDVFTSPVERESVAHRYWGRNRRIPFYDFDHRGASAVYSSAHDLVRFGMFHLKNRLEGQKAILGDETIDRMVEDSDPGVPGINYKLGWSVSEKFGYTYVSHTGGMPGVSTSLSFMPDENIVVVVLCNCQYGNLGRIVEDIYGALLPEFEKRRKDSPAGPQQKPSLPSTTPPAFLGEWTGAIATHAGDVPVGMEFREGAEVFLRLRGGENAVVEALSPAGRFNLENDVFNGRFRFQLPPEDVSRLSHMVLIDLKIIDGRLTGVASAMASNGRFRLPSYICLTKKQ